MPTPTFNQQFIAALIDSAKNVDDFFYDPTDQSFTSRRFDVYRNNVFMGLINNLKAAYPVVERLVGEEFFMAMADTFNRHFLPENPLLWAFAQNFPEFISEFPPAQSVPYLADIACVERARRKAFHAIDESFVTLDELQKIPHDLLPEVTFKINASTSFVKSDFPINTIWQINQPEANQENIPPDVKAETVLICRQDFSIMQYSVPEEKIVFVSAILSGKTLGQASLLTQEKSEQCDIAANLTYLFEVQCITEINAQPDL